MTPDSKPQMQKEAENIMQDEGQAKVHKNTVLKDVIITEQKR